MVFPAFPFPVKLLYPNPGLFSLHPCQATPWMRPQQSSSIFNHSWWELEWQFLLCTPSSGPPNPKCGGAQEGPEGAEPQEGARSSRGCARSWEELEGREGILLWEFWECAAPQRKSVPLQEPATPPEAIPAKEPGKSLMEAHQGARRAARALPDPGSHPGQRSRPSTLSRSQILLLHPQSPQFPRQSHYLRSPLSFLLSLWCRSHFHLPLLFSFSSTFTTSFSWPEGTPELGGEGTWGSLGPALLQVGPPEGAQGFVQGSFESLQGRRLALHRMGNWDHVLVWIFPDIPKS